MAVNFAFNPVVSVGFTRFQMEDFKLPFGTNREFFNSLCSEIQRIVFNIEHTFLRVKDDLKDLDQLRVWWEEWNEIIPIGVNWQASYPDLSLQWQFDSQEEINAAKSIHFWLKFTLDKGVELAKDPTVENAVYRMFIEYTNDVPKIYVELKAAMLYIDQRGIDIGSVLPGVNYADPKLGVEQFLEEWALKFGYGSNPREPGFNWELQYSMLKGLF